MDRRSLLLGVACTALAGSASAQSSRRAIGPLRNARRSVQTAVSSLTYAQFVSSVTAKAVDGSKTWGSTIGNGAALKVVTTATTPTGAMDGTSWSDATGFDSSGASYARIVQHALPDDGVTFNENVTSGRIVYMEAVASSLVTAALTGKTRNGFTSSSAPSDLVNVRRVTRVAWWSAALGKPLETDPSIGGAPIDYVP